MLKKKERKLEKDHIEMIMMNQPITFIFTIPQLNLIV